MKITHLGSATELIETKGLKILTDPWMIDGAFYGSWFHYPPLKPDWDQLADIDFIYVSHVHSDHFDPKTFEHLPKTAPVLIHRFQAPFLKRNIERTGFEVIEVPHGTAFDLGNGVSLSIFGADNCDPSICGHMFGCVPEAPLRGSMQLDSLMVLADGDYTLVNTNDCPFDIARTALLEVKRRFPMIDFALVGYTSASLFPHCMSSYSDAEIEAGKAKAIARGISTAQRTVAALKPRYFMPFAGTYILGGKLADLTEKLPIVEQTDAVQQILDFQSSGVETEGILLNHNHSFDVASGAQSAPFVPPDPAARLAYAKTELAGARFPYEEDPTPELADFEAVLPDAYARFAAKRSEVGIKEDHTVYVPLTEGKMLSLPLGAEGYKIVDEASPRAESHSYFRMDPRLTLRVLKGPRFANWNNIEIGAHLEFDRKPDTYRQDVHILMNSLYQ